MRRTTKRLWVAGALATALLVPAGVAVASGSTGAPTATTTQGPGAGYGPGPGRGPGMGMWTANGHPAGWCLSDSAKARELRQEHRQEMRQLRQDGGTWEDLQELRQEHRRDMQRLWESR